MCQNWTSHFCFNQIAICLFCKTLTHRSRLQFLRCNFGSLLFLYHFSFGIFAGVKAVTFRTLDFRFNFRQFWTFSVRTSHYFDFRASSKALQQVFAFFYNFSSPITFILFSEFSFSSLIFIFFHQFSFSVVNFHKRLKLNDFPLFFTTFKSRNSSLKIRSSVKIEAIKFQKEWNQWRNFKPIPSTKLNPFETQNVPDKFGTWANLP